MFKKYLDKINVTALVLTDGAVFLIQIFLLDEQ